MCPHEINIKHKSCERCEEIAAAEMRIKARLRRINPKYGCFKKDLKKKK
jgi:hypothetical protein